MSAVIVTTCQGCGKAIPPSRGGRARKWCSERCRKMTLYGGTCSRCGARTSYASGGTNNTPSAECQPCHEHLKHQHRRWTPEAIIDVIRLWADEHGGVPPVASDWNASVASTPRGDRFPAVSVVQHEFGTWRDAIAAAGFDAFKPGHYGREGEYPEVVAETISLYRSGLSALAVGERMGVSAPTVLHRLKVAGEPRRPAGGRWGSA